MARRITIRIERLLDQRRQQVAQQLSGAYDRVMRRLDDQTLDDLIDAIKLSIAGRAQTEAHHAARRVYAELDRKMNPVSIDVLSERLLRLCDGDENKMLRLVAAQTEA